MIRMLNTVWKNTIKTITASGTVSDTIREGTMLARIAMARRDLTLSFGGEVLHCSFGGITMAGKVIPGAFPDYTRVIMGEADHTIIVDAFEMTRALGQVMPNLVWPAALFP
jgi:DNA polymerase III sliding clamp (beta) subunit (PCNA family)